MCHYLEAIGLQDFKPGLVDVAVMVVGAGHLRAQTLHYSVAATRENAFELEKKLNNASRAKEDPLLTALSWEVFSQLRIHATVPLDALAAKSWIHPHERQD